MNKGRKDWSDHRTSSRLSSGKEEGALEEVDAGRCVCSTERGGERVK